MRTNAVKIVGTVVVLVGLLALAGCGKDSDFWFAGNLEDATRQSSERGDLVMVNFFTDW